MKNKGFGHILLIVVLAILAGFLLWITRTTITVNSPKWKAVDDSKMIPTEDPSTGVCSMDAKQCPDGTSVARQGPNCEFAECPSTNMNSFSLEKVLILQSAKKVFEKLYPQLTINVDGQTLYNDGIWGHGTVGVSNPKNNDGGGDIILYVAHKAGSQWEIIPESDSRYKSLFQQLPDSIISKEVKDFYLK